MGTGHGVVVDGCSCGEGIRMCALRIERPTAGQEVGEGVHVRKLRRVRVCIQCVQGRCRSEALLMLTEQRLSLSVFHPCGCRWSELSPYFTRIWTMMLRAMVGAGLWALCGTDHSARGKDKI